PPRPAPFPYTTLFRSREGEELFGTQARGQPGVGPFHQLRDHAKSLGLDRFCGPDEEHALQLRPGEVATWDGLPRPGEGEGLLTIDRKSTRLNSSHVKI